MLSSLNPLGFLLLGLASSSHCALMCGPLIASANHNHLSGQGSTSLLLMQLGRVCCYSLLGAIAGAAGQQLGLWLDSGDLRLARIIMLLTTLVVFGLWISGKLKTQHRCSAASAHHSLGHAWLKGMALALIPCPLLITVLLYSSLLGNPALAAFGMFCFALSSATLPTFLAGGLARWQRRLLPKQRSLATLGLLLLALLSTPLLSAWAPVLFCQ